MMLHTIMMPAGGGGESCPGMYGMQLRRHRRARADASGTDLSTASARISNCSGVVVIGEGWRPEPGSLTARVIRLCKN